MVRIRKRYLEAMERGDFSHLPEGAPARGFVRNYARFLGLNPEAAVAALEAEIGVPVILREAQLPPPERPRMTSRYTQLEPPGARWRGALPDETTAELDALALNEEQHSANNGLVPTPPDAASRLPSAWRLRPASDSGPNGAQRLPRSPHLRPLSSPKPSAHSSTWLRRALRMFAAITIVASAAGLLLPRLSSVVETLSNAARPATPSTAAPKSFQPQPLPRQRHAPHPPRLHQAQPLPISQASCNWCSTCASAPGFACALMSVLCSRASCRLARAHPSTANQSPSRPQTRARLRSS